jgi:HPt (histidine-containing phosphotransfer) domain-containing protein
VDRQSIARARRAKLVRELLAEELEREQALQEALEDRIEEADGPGVDEEVLARMNPDEAGLVRDRLSTNIDDGLPSEEEFWNEDEPEAVAHEDDLEEEIARLEQELELSRRQQEAYRRYLELLGE